MPGNGKPLDGEDDEIERNAHNAGQDDGRPGIGKTELGRFLGDVHAQRGTVAAEVFADNGANHAEGGRHLERVEDVG